jgi:hypothetical protein
MGILFFFLIIFFLYIISLKLIYSNTSTPIIEGMLDVVPSFVPTFSPTMNPTAAPTNEMLPNLTINQVYRQYDKKIADNTFLMAQQNAGNIEYLKERMDAVQGIFKEVQDISGNVAALQDQMNQLIVTQQQYATQITGGGTMPDITGTVSDSDTPIDTSELVTS